MNTIEFNDVWKKFRKGEKFNSLRDSVPNFLRKIIPGGNGPTPLEDKEFWAVKDVNFQVKKGEVVGIIGPNGAGKSTILKLLSGIMVPDQGTMCIRGRLSALIEVTAGFHPELTGRENIYLNGTILGMKKKEIEEKFDQIVEFSGIEEFIDTPVKRYSSGMYSRLGFSVAVHVNPDVLLVDEVLSVGDIAFRSKCAQKMRELLKSGATIVIVSHNLQLIQSLCQRAILLHRGEAVREGAVEEVIPYYENLISSQSENEFKRKIQAANNKVKIKNQQAALRILNVRLMDDSRKEKEAFDAGENLTIEIECKANEKIESPIFSIEILRADGVLCCSSNTRDNGLALGHIEGDNTIKVNFGKITLGGGIYLMRISVWDRDMIHSYAIRKKDVFRIELDGSRRYADEVFLQKMEWQINA